MTRRAVGAACSAVVAAAIALSRAAAGQPPPSPGYDVRVPDKIDAVAGANGTLPIRIAVDRGLSISRDAALVLDLAPDAGLAIKHRRLGRRDAVDPEADEPRFAIPVRADAAGDHRIAVHLRFWLCGTYACRPIDVRRTVQVAVTAAESPPSPP